MAFAGQFQRLGLTPEALTSAGLRGVGLFAFLAVVLFTELPSLLPGYPAVLVAFGIWCILPGWFLQRSLFATASTNLVEQVAVAFLMSLAVGAVPGLLGLRLHWTIEGFGLAYAAVAGLATVFAELLGERRPVDDGADDSGPLPTKVLLVLIGIPLLAIATSPWWEDGRVARDADDLVYVAYVAEYQDSELDAAKPFSDTRRGAFGRIQFNVWLVEQALLVDSSGVSPLSLLLSYLPPIMTLLVVCAMFALAKGLFGSERVALLACAFVLLYGALDLSAHEGYGRNVFLRIGEDKMVASFILLPIGLLLSARFLDQGNVRDLGSSVLAIAALFATHPIAVMLLGAVVIVLVLLRIAIERTTESFRRSVVMVLPVAGVGLGLYLGAVLGAGRVNQIGETFRREFHLNDLPGDLIVGNYHLILHPLVLLTLALTVVLGLLFRERLGVQVLVASAVASLAIMFFPPLSTLVANVVNEEAVWRAHWLLPVPLTLAYGLHALVRRLPEEGLNLGAWGLSRHSIPLVGVAVIVAGAFVVQEAYAFADDGAFYNRTSETALLPLTQQSIFLGGAERAFSSEWQPKADDWEVLKYLEEQTAPGMTVIAPDRIARYFPGLFPLLRAVDEPESADLAERRTFLGQLEAGILPTSSVLEGLDRYSVDVVITQNFTIVDDVLRTAELLQADRFEYMGGTSFQMLSGEGDVSGIGAIVMGSEREGSAQITFTVPLDADGADLTLDYDILAAPAAPVDEPTTARLTLAVTTLEGDEIFERTVDVEMAQQPDGGEPFLRRISPNVDMEPGGTYRLSISRNPSAAKDSYGDDLWLIAARVRYWPDYSMIVGETNFRVYETSGG